MFNAIGEKIVVLCNIVRIQIERGQHAFSLGGTPTPMRGGMAAMIEDDLIDIINALLVELNPHIVGGT